MLTRETYINEIVSRLSYLESTVKCRNSLNLYDIDIHAESFFCELLNLSFGYKLENLNHFQNNFDSIDLGDKENKISVQITAQDTRAKIQGTLDKFIENGHKSEYDRLIVLIIGTKPKFRKPFNTGGAFCFDADTDVWDIKYLIKKINEKPIDELSRICDFFKKQLYPNEGYIGSNLNKLGAKMLNEMHSICKEKLLSIGISGKIADEIIEADVNGTKYQYILDDVADEKRYLVGEFGSGKSHSLLIIAQRLMKEYLTGNSTVFPLYVRGREVFRVGSVKQWLKDLGFEEVNCFLLIDGLDEIEHSFARQLIEEINILSVQYTQYKILATSRPLTILATELENTVRIRPLTNAECISLYNIVSDGECGEDAFRSISENMRKTLEKPFFCIIYALFKSEPKSWAKQDIDLITALVTKSMQKAGQYAESVLADLASLAVKTIDRDFGDVHISEIHFLSSIENVMATGFVSLVNNYISFPLPIIAQWMAAEAIRLRIIDIDSIISNSHRINKWLYSLSILFSQISFEESLELFSKIVRKSPGTASRIIRDGIRFDTMASFPDAYECGEMLQQTMQIWVDALGPLSNWIAPLHRGKIRPLGINIEHGGIVYSWLNSGDDTRPVQVLSFKEMQKWGSTIHGRGVPAQATWPWFVTFDYLSDNLKKAIQSHMIIPDEGQIKEEFLWDTLLHISGKGSLYEGKLDLAAFEKYRQFIGKRWLVSGKEIPTNFLFYLIDKHVASGHTIIATPYPTSDRSNHSGWVWSGYSAERFLEKVRFVYHSALNEYTKLVNSIFEKFQCNLRTAVLSPCMIVGKLKFHENSVTFADSPQLTWYMKALPESEHTCVDIQLGEIPSSHLDLFNSLLRNNMMLRPDAMDKRIASITSGYVDICNSTPVTNLVFSWLRDELKEIGWIE